MGAKNRVRSWIARCNGNPIAATIAGAAERYLNAYNNYSNWDMEHNGELRALRLVIEQVEGDVFDVGANSGQWANAVLPFLGPRRLHSFEPVPDIYEMLVKAVPASPQIRLNNLGLGKTTGTIEINYSPNWSSISSLYPLIYEERDQRVIPCRFTTGDAYMEENGIERVSLLKIDVEGMEMDVLEGFPKAFANGRLETVQFEHGPSHVHSGHMLLHFTQFFEDRGFNVYAIYPRRLKLLKYALERESFAGQNLLAVRKDIEQNLSL